MTQALKSDLTHAHEMMARVLRDGSSLVDEYPLVFQSGFPGQIVALSEGDDVRSACAVLVRDFLSGGLSVRVGLIGSVTTHPDHRHSGLATRVLAKAEDILREKGCAIALLWADDPKFYFSRGYCPVGTELDFTLDADAVANLPTVPGIRPAVPEDSRALHSLYTRHLERVVRVPQETEALLGCPEMRVLVVDNGTGPTAYACMGRGGDMRSVVHEWGGDLVGVLGLIRAQAEAENLEREDSQLFVMAPERRADLRLALVEAGAVCTAGILGLGKLLDRAAGAKLLRLSTGAAVELEGQRPDGRVCLLTEEGPVVLSDADLLSLLMPAHGDRSALAKAAKDLGLHTHGLPLHAFAWGLDSI